MRQHNGRVVMIVEAQEHCRDGDGGVVARQRSWQRVRATAEVAVWRRWRRRCGRAEDVSARRGGGGGRCGYVARRKWQQRCNSAEDAAAWRGGGGGGGGGGGAA